MSETTATAPEDRLELAVDIITAYVSNNSVPAADLPALIGGIHAALSELAAPPAAEPPEQEKLSAAQIRKSITHGHLVSFEDGKTYKTLRRHLTLRGLTPEAYRTKWGLPRDYPMTAQSYSEQRSQLARSLGLGQQRRKNAAAGPGAGAPPEPAKAGGRKRPEAEPAE